MGIWVIVKINSLLILIFLLSGCGDQSHLEDTIEMSLTEIYDDFMIEDRSLSKQQTTVLGKFKRDKKLEIINKKKLSKINYYTQYWIIESFLGKNVKEDSCGVFYNQYEKDNKVIQIYLDEVSQLLKIVVSSD